MPKIRFTDGGIIRIDGKLYEVTGRHDKEGGAICKPLDVERLNFLVEKLSKKLVEFVNKEEIIKQALRELPIKHLERINKNLREKKKVKKKGGCIQLKIGNDFVFIR